MINDRIFNKNYFTKASDLEDTKNINDELYEYYDFSKQELVQKYISKEDLRDLPKFNDLAERFKKGENVSKELNALYVFRGEPAIRNLDKELEDLMKEKNINPNKTLNDAKINLDKNEFYSK